jgi:dUTP pyrophosphatase
MKFRKVSLKEYAKSFVGFETEIDDIGQELADIPLPKRGTKKSAGYDFYTPFQFKLSNEPDSPYPKTIKIPTGIRAILDDDKFLMCCPRSGLGFKYKIQLYNTVGIIDADYSESDNEGHIFAKITIDTEEPVTVEFAKGSAFMQGIVLQYFTMEDDDAETERNGGFGSTDS